MSEIKVNKISPRTACGTVTLGDSGDTFTIPAGATITNNGTAAGFGATGAASWDTTVKTATFTAVSGVGYFVNTTAGAISVNLPAGTAGDVVAIKDYANTFDTNACTLVQNGSDKIGGSAVNATLLTEGQAVTLVFIDSTQGWLVTDSGLQSDANTNPYIVATGGTIITNGDFKTHIFTGPGDFCVSSAGNPVGSNTVDYLVVAGGGGTGGGSGCQSGGGGAGGFRISNSAGCIPAPTMSPLVAPTNLPVSIQSYPITVGAGGAIAPSAPGTPSNNGNNSIFATVTSAGGGGGSGGTSPSPEQQSGKDGGSGGGGAAAQGAGNTPPVSPPQGNPGGDGARASPQYGSGGGGGAGAAGTAGTSSNAGPGGAGSYIADTVIGPTAPSYGTPGPVSSTRYLAGGGGGGGEGSSGSGGAGGGGAGVSNPVPTSNPGTINTGGGAGTGNDSAPGASGGSGIVIIRYKFQN